MEIDDLRSQSILVPFGCRIARSNVDNFTGLVHDRQAFVYRGVFLEV